jgi:hypothetical protein
VVVDALDVPEDASLMFGVVLAVPVVDPGTG